jgi:predicted nucleic-acid-binding Zn-ribbon protein
MMTQCPKCGSMEIIPDLILISSAGGMAGSVRVVLVDPSGKGDNVATGFRVDICGNCGYTEMHTKFANDLLNAYKKGYVTYKP